ncbi:MAG: hypothetical protein AAB554_02005 [Patescibacteria group bacterium]
MTRAEPPKIAPKDVPPEAALYLDDAAGYLTELVKEYGLELKTYDLYRPEHSAWLHGLYGKCRDRQICIQVVTDAEMAPNRVALLKGYIRMYPGDGRNEWLLFETRRVRGMAGLMAGTADMADRLFLACVWRIPHPNSPDPKA